MSLLKKFAHCLRQDFSLPHPGTGSSSAGADRLLSAGILEKVAKRRISYTLLLLASPARLVKFGRIDGGFGEIMARGWTGGGIPLFLLQGNRCLVNSAAAASQRDHFRLDLVLQPAFLSTAVLQGKGIDTPRGAPSLEVLAAAAKTQSRWHCARTRPYLYIFYIPGRRQ